MNCADIIDVDLAPRYALRRSAGTVDSPLRALRRRASAAYAFRRPRPVVCGKGGVDRNLPPEPAAMIPESARILRAEDDLVFRLKRNNEILAIAPYRDLSPV